MPDLKLISKAMTEVRSEMARVIMGQGAALEQLATCLLAGGHVILEGVPGLGKTLLAKSLAKLVDAEFRRIQFTPDLLPSDIVGTNVFNAQTSKFSLYKGPVFTEILLADEINRTPPKTQAALLEAMEEKQITIDGVKNLLPELFFVIATQNPVEYEGTYPLPETQLDRFMMKIVLDYPSQEAELAVMRHYADGVDLQNLERLIPSRVLAKEEILTFRNDVLKVTVREEVMRYMQQIIEGTRDTAYVQLGASTRAAVWMLKAARSLAAIRGSNFVSPEEIKDVTVPVLRHRVILRPEALIDGLTSDYFLGNILRSVPVPR
ncbi:MAG TPA: MoxR family ATPase [Desulfomonilaceae bacterium]|nr:MoxR family ATPase [Desulfomonilaceae bacterium]